MLGIREEMKLIMIYVYYQRSLFTMRDICASDTEYLLARTEFFTHPVAARLID